MDGWKMQLRETISKALSHELKIQLVDGKHTVNDIVANAGGGVVAELIELTAQLMWSLCDAPNDDKERFAQLTTDKIAETLLASFKQLDKVGMPMGELSIMMSRSVVNAPGVTVLDEEPPKTYQ